MFEENVSSLFTMVTQQNRSGIVRDVSELSGFGVPVWPKVKIGRECGIETYFGTVHSKLRDKTTDGIYTVQHDNVARDR